MHGVSVSHAPCGSGGGRRVADIRFAQAGCPFGNPGFEKTPWLGESAWVFDNPMARRGQVLRGDSVNS